MVECGREVGDVGEEGKPDVGVGSSLPASFCRMRCMATAKSSRVS